MAKIVVCGSEGSLMSYVLPWLEGHEVWGIDTCERYGHRGRVAETEDYNFINVDLCDREKVNTIFDAIKPDFVIQAAAKIYGVGGFNKNRADILADDVALHSNVLQACVNVGVKSVVFISSSMVYESVNKGYIPCAEHDVWDYGIPKTDYGLSKMVNERLCHSFQAQYGLNYLIYRPFNIITPHEDAGAMGDSHVFADFFKRLVLEDAEELPIYGDGEQVRCFTWIDDAAHQIADTFMWNWDKTRNRAYNIGNNQPINMKQLAREIRKQAYELRMVSTPDVRFNHLDPWPNDVTYRVPDISLIQEVMDWTPKTTWQESVHNCLTDKSFLDKLETYRVGRNLYAGSSLEENEVHYNRTMRYGV